jgi:Uma2 family endonuclease
MGAHPPQFAGDHVLTADQRIVMYGVPWTHFEAHLALRGDRSFPRMSYLEGAMELMSPFRDHERIKSYIGCLLEAYALQNDIDMSPYGGWTLKNAPKEAGLEPDECYIVGDQAKDRPDLAIEVAWTAGGINKLEIYRRLGVGEVWLWRRGEIEIHALSRGDYERARRSVLFPGLDMVALLSFLDRPTALQAVKAFRAGLTAVPPPGRRTPRSARAETSKTRRR